MDDRTETTKSAKVLEFLTIAHEYNRILEECTSYPREHFLAYLQRILPLLYLKGSLLPEIEPSDDDMNERFLTEEEWEIILNSLRGVFGDEHLYWSIGDACGHEPEAIRKSLAEDLSDIYQETKDFVLLYQKPFEAARENAIASCRFYFGEHWGEKALMAAARIHHMVHGHHHNHEDDTDHDA
jgi:hypothetical protein